MFFKSIYAVYNLPSEFSASELIRGCCRIETGSPTCPPGADFQVRKNPYIPLKKKKNEIFSSIIQIQTQNSFTYYYTRCSGDLCNDSDGLDNTVQEVMNLHIYQPSFPFLMERKCLIRAVARWWWRECRKITITSARESAR